MFEKYTEKARRVIFFARYEASQLGAQAIDTEHLLLGLLRGECTRVVDALAATGVTLESVRARLARLKNARS